MTERSDTLNNQAIILASDGDYPGAIACFKRAIIIEKNNYLLWYNLGVTYRDSGDLTKAEQALEKAYQINPENEDVIEALATLFLQEKKYQETMYYCLQGSNLNPNNAHFWNLEGVIHFQEENYGMAAEYFEVAVSINPYYEDALYNLKDTYAELGNKFGVEELNKRLLH